MQEHTLSLEEVDADGAIREAAEHAATDSRAGFLARAGVFGGGLLGGGALLGLAYAGDLGAGHGRVEATGVAVGDDAVRHRDARLRPRGHRPGRAEVDVVRMCQHAQDPLDVLDGWRGWRKGHPPTV